MNKHNKEDDDDIVPNKISVDEAVERCGCGRFQHRILFAAGLSFSADGTEVLLLSFLSPLLGDVWNLSPRKAALIISVLFAGSLIGIMILGSMGDVYGRRPIYLISSTFVSLFGLGTSFASSYYLLLTMIFCVGFSVGGLTVPFDILAEFLPSDVRGQFLLRIEYYWTIGTLAVPLFAYFTIGMDLSWNVFVFVCSTPCIIGTVCGAYIVPESPHWLVAQGRNEEAMMLVRRAASINKKDPNEIFPEGTEIKVHYHENSSYAELFKPKWRRITLLLWEVWFGLAFAYYGTIMVVTKTFHSQGETGSDSFDYKDIFISSSAEFIGTAIAIRTVDRIGRIKSQAIYYSLGGIFVFLICVVSSNVPFSILVVVAFLARAFEMSASCCTWVSTAEVFGTEVRTTGHASANAVARLGGILCPLLVESDISLPIIGTVLLCIHLLIVAFISHVPETNGKQLGQDSSEPEELSLNESQTSALEITYELT